MILSKDSNNNWTPTAGGTGTFIGTLAAFNAIKDTLPVNTVAYITDDGNGDLQPVDAITNGDMHPVTSNAVYDKFASIAAVDYVENGNMHPVTGNAVYDFPIGYIIQSQPRPPTSGAVYDALKPKMWTSSINIGASTWTVTISRSVDFVHVRLRCTATGAATGGTTVNFPNAPDWCKVKQTISEVTTFERAIIDLQTNNAITCWSSMTLENNSEWNAVALAFDAEV
jgi:hypothetical protein